MSQRISRRALFGAAGTFGAAACASWPAVAGAADAYTLRFGIAAPAASSLGAAAIRYASAVNHRSNGQVKVEVYPNGQLASQQETVAALTSGVMDFTIQQTAILVPQFPRFEIFDLPFLFKNSAGGFRVLDGPIGDEFSADLEGKGLTVLGWGTGGFRQIETTAKTVVGPDDLKGLRMRIQSSAIYVAMYRALGATPVPIDMSEAMVALTQRTVDGLDLVLDTIATGKYYTVIKHVATSNHVFAVSPILGSKRKIDALPAPVQKMLRQEAKFAAQYWRALAARQVDENVEDLKKNGVAFSEIDYPAFRKLMDPLYAGVQSKFGGDLLARINRAAGA